MAGVRIVSSKQINIWLAGLQAATLSLVAFVFAALPPSHGAVLAVSLRARSAAGLLGKDTQLLGAGRLPGSLVISGDRPSFWAALTRNGVLILPAVPALCGAVPPVES